MSMSAMVWLALSYLLGAIPFGLLFGRMLGSIDVRTVGSGNIGATNVLRSAGKGAAVLTLLADGGKGFLPVLLAPHVASDAALPVMAGIAAIIGHNFPVYLGFKGGKGVATSFGVALAVSPWAGCACLITWLAAALIWRYSSLAALVSFALLPVILFITKDDDMPRLLGLFVFGMIYYRHRENIKRLLAGTEPRIGSRT